MTLDAAILWLIACLVPELCSVLGSGSVPALQKWLSSVLDCRWSEKLLGFSPVMSVSGITTTRACSFSFSCVPHSPCSSCSSLGNIASTELALSMVRSARLPSGCTSLKTCEKLVHTKTHAWRLTHTSVFLYSWGPSMTFSYSMTFYILPAWCYFYGQVDQSYSWPKSHHKDLVAVLEPSILSHNLHKHWELLGDV